MKHYQKSELEKLVYEKGGTTWDVWEYLKVSDESVYSKILKNIFQNDKEYYSLRSQIVNNNKDYNNLHPISNNISVEYLMQLVNQGENKISFMRLFRCSGTSLYYKAVKEIFTDNKALYKEFCDKVTQNTAVSFGKSTNKNGSLVQTRKKKAQNATTVFSSPKTKDLSKSAVRDTQNSLVFIYAADYLYKNRAKENFGIPTTYEALILDFAHKFFSDMGDSQNTINSHMPKRIFSALASKIFFTIKDNPNINFAYQTSPYEFIHTKYPGSYDNHSMFNVMPKNNDQNNDRTCICCVDNDLLITLALDLLKEGKYPIIVTDNVITMINCVELGINCIPTSLELLDKNILALSNKTFEDKEAYLNLPYICFDTCYIMNQKEKFINYLCSTDSIKVIFSCVYEELLANIQAKCEKVSISDIYNIIFAVTFNPTVRIVSTASAFSRRYVYTDNMILNHILKLRNDHDVILATNDSKMAVAAYSAGVKLEYIGTVPIKKSTSDNLGSTNSPNTLDNSFYTKKAADTTGRELRSIVSAIINSQKK